MYKTKPITAIVIVTTAKYELLNAIIFIHAKIIDNRDKPVPVY